MKRIVCAVGATLALTVTPVVAAWPDKPVTLIVPFPPGGSANMIARTLRPKLTEKFGNTFIVERRAGAGGTVGATYVNINTGVTNIKAKLHQAIVTALNDPAIKPKLPDLGFEIVGDTPEQFAAFQAGEFARLKRVIEVGKITAD